MVTILEWLLKKVVRLFFKVLFLFEDQPFKNRNVKKAISLYQEGTFSELFTQIRLWDSPHQEIEELTPKKGVIVDLGCGDGFLSNYLAISSNKRRITGIELNPRRIKEANKGLKNTKFIPGNILITSIPKADAILLVHVLHHLPSKNDQTKLVNNCYKSLKKGGSLIIVEINNKPLLKYLFTYFTDAVIVPILFDKKIFDKTICYRNKDQWENLLKDTGFKVKSSLADYKKPFSHIIFKCTK